ncbi:MAG: ABC transporter ATP-binding protein [Clostridia bacterium]|nr:ABC transporter ATP-binding protein [Clostridia bacterium]
METILKLLKPYRASLILVAIVDALGMLTTLLMPYVMSEVVESGIARGDMPLVWRYGALMLLLAVMSIVTSLISVKLNTRITARYSADLCQATFEKINSLSYSDYSKIGPSGLLTRATDDIFNIEEAVTSLPYMLVTVPIMLIGSTVLSLMADVTLSLVFMISIPAVLLLVYILMRPLGNMWDKADRYIDVQNKIVRERLSCLRVVRAFNNEHREHARAKQATEEMSKYMIQANTRGSFVEPFAMLLLNLATVAVVYFGGIKAQSSQTLGAGDIIAVLQYIALISNALISISWTLSWLPRLKVSVNRINEVHSLKSEQTSESDITVEGFRVDMKDVSFTYPDSNERVLKNISLSVGEGERVAVIGGTGSGKTTLVRLLTGLFDATEGEITLAGAPYTALTKSEVRRHFSVALQKAAIFEGTVRENIKMGNPNATDEEIYEVLRLSKIDDYVNSHEEGLDYLLVGMGRNASGGQKQRLSMARTVIKDVDVYIFDDSFSALDFLTESEIRANYLERLKGKTQIFVTQRVSTAMSAERIYVMADGEIVAVGDHDTLLSECEIYREIAESQLGRVGGEKNEKN